MRDVREGVSEDARAALPARAESGGTDAGLADPPVVLYDGWCNLCDSSVAFILRRDRRAVFRFAALQSAAAVERLARCGAADLTGETLVLFHRGRCLTRSQALLTIVGSLPWPWPWLTALGVLPRGLRDRAYDFVARNRSKWFGRPKVCMTSLAGYGDRFLE